MSSWILLFLGIHCLSSVDGQIKIKIDTSKFNLEPLKALVKDMPFISRDKKDTVISIFDNPIQAIANATSTPICQRPAPYETLTLALQWTPGLCHQSKRGYCNREKVVNYFTIHGLWPSSLKSNSSSSRKKVKHPEFCCNQNFNMTDAKASIHGLDRVWPTVLQKSSLESFLDHEWRKHGSCAHVSSPKIKSHADYFNVTGQLYNKTKVGDWLASEKILPRHNYAYSTEQIHRAISSKIGDKDVIVSCRIQNKVSYLKEIRICFDPDTLEYKDCYGRNRDHNCKNNRAIIIPRN